MGFLKGIANVVVGAVNKVAGTNMSIGSSSGGDSSPQLTVTQQAMMALMQQKMPEIKAALGTDGKGVTGIARAGDEFQKWLSSAEGQKALKQVEAQISAGSPVSGPKVKELINNVTTSLGNTAIGSLNKVVDKNIVSVGDKIAGGLFGGIIDKNKGTLSQALGGLGSATLSETLKQWFKKNWYFLLLPLGGLIYLIIQLIKGATGKSKQARFRT